MASEKQVELMMKLRAEITALDPERTHHIADNALCALSGGRGGDASRYIDLLFASITQLRKTAGTTRPAGTAGDAELLATIPAGVYACEVENSTEIRFFQVDHGTGKWTGRIFLEETNGHDGDARVTYRLSRDERAEVLAEIAGDVEHAAALYLTHSPDAAAAALGRAWMAKVPAGRYALKLAGTDRLFKVTHRNGFQLVEVNGERGYMERSGEVAEAERESVLTAIAADVEAAARAFGYITFTCSCCGRELTNKVSRDLGIGPICRGKLRKVIALAA